jgi:hypothetical protein
MFNSSLLHLDASPALPLLYTAPAVRILCVSIASIMYYCGDTSCLPLHRSKSWFWGGLAFSYAVCSDSFTRPKPFVKSGRQPRNQPFLRGPGFMLLLGLGAQVYEPRRAITAAS